MPTTHQGRTFDWKPRFDERSRAFGIEPLEAEFESQYWWCTPRLDQGAEGACVGFGWMHSIDAVPHRHRYQNDRAHGLYELAKTLDDFPGTDYEGTSVLAGAKAAQQAGYVTSYRWAFSIEDVATAIMTHGPVVIGVNWHADMMQPDAAGFIHPSGEVVGGHCTCVRALHVEGDQRFFVIRNSWGMGWGRKGDCFIAWDDLAALLADDGEACVPSK